MPKIDIAKVAEIIKKNRIDPATTRRIIEEMNLAAQPDPEKEEKAPAAKKQWVILQNGPALGWVLQIEENASPATVGDRIRAAAHAFNDSKKGRKVPVDSIGEALENVPARWFKTEENRTSVKTKLPVIVVQTDNKLA